jgi:hypothetical protein
VRVDRAIDQLVVNEAALLQRLSADEQQRLAGLLRTLGADFDDTSDTGEGTAL